VSHVPLNTPGQPHIIIWERERFRGLRGKGERADKDWRVEGGRRKWEGERFKVDTQHGYD
jgi:hypothetical protein